MYVRLVAFANPYKIGDILEVMSIESNGDYRLVDNSWGDLGIPYGKHEVELIPDIDDLHS